jgi:hypothetical protein
MSTAPRLLHGFIFSGALAGFGCQGLQGTPPLALDQLGVSALASDGTNVYWTMASGDVRSAPTVGGSVQQVSKTVGPGQLVLDVDSAYWGANNGEIQRAPKAGGSPETLVENVTTLGALQVDEGSLYWMVGQSEGALSGQVVKAPKAPAAAQTVLLPMSPLDPNTLTLTGATLYYAGAVATSAPVGLTELGVTGSAPVTDVQGTFTRVASATATVCGAGPDPVALAADPTSAAQAITCSALDGSNPRLVATGLTAVVTSVALDDTTVYFATADGAVSAVPVAATSPVDMSGSSSDGTASGQPVGAGTCFEGAACTCSGAASGAQVCDSMGNGTCQCSGAATFAMGVAGGASVAIDDTNVYWAQSAGNAVFALPRN